MSEILEKNIKENKEAFDAWISGSKIWVKELNEWTLLKYPNWESEISFFVLNDNYSELRKAIVDGKIVQLKGMTQWVDTTASSFKNYPVNWFRIKPSIIFYKRDQIPKQHCFSRRDLNGSFYEDTCNGSNKSWHQYDGNGDIYKTSVIPEDNGYVYYLSNAKGEPIEKDSVEEPLKKFTVFKEVTITYSMEIEASSGDEAKNILLTEEINNSNKWNIFDHKIKKW